MWVRAIHFREVCLRLVHGHHNPIAPFHGVLPRQAYLQHLTLHILHLIRWEPDREKAKERWESFQEGLLSPMKLYYFLWTCFTRWFLARKHWLNMLDFEIMLALIYRFLFQTLVISFSGECVSGNGGWKPITQWNQILWKFLQSKQLWQPKW